MKKILMVTFLLLSLLSKTATALTNEGFAERLPTPAIPAPHHIPAMPAIDHITPLFACVGMIAAFYALNRCIIDRYFPQQGNVNNNVEIGRMALQNIPVGQRNIVGYNLEIGRMALPHHGLQHPMPQNNMPVNHNG